MILCRHCNQGYPEIEPHCPYCLKNGSKENARHSNNFIPQETGGKTPPPTKNMSLLLALGIFFFPLFFSWITLQKGYSSLSKILALSWLGVFVFSFIINVSIVNANSQALQSVTQSPAYCYDHSDSKPTTLPLLQQRCSLKPQNLCRI